MEPPGKSFALSLIHLIALGVGIDDACEVTVVSSLGHSMIILKNYKYVFFKTPEECWLLLACCFAVHRVPVTFFPLMLKLMMREWLAVFGFSR